MGKSGRRQGEAIVSDDQKTGYRPILPRQEVRVVQLQSPSGAYRISPQAMEQISRVEARSARVLSTAASFAFR